MKLRRIIAAASAAAVVASAVAATASANFANMYAEGSDNQQFACLASNDWHPVMLNDAADLDDVTGFKMTLSIENYKDYKSDKGEGFWFGGAIGANSPSTGWKNLATWGHEGGTEDVIWEETGKGEWTVTYNAGAPIFAASDNYAFLWIQDYSELKDAYEYAVSNLVLLDAAGNDVNAADAVVEPDVPAEETVEAPVEETVEAPVEETVEEPVDETVEIIETEESASTDLADYFDGSTVMLYGEDGGYLVANDMALTDVYGVKYYVTFDDAELADESVWVGGGVGANSDSTGWEQHEWGKASGEKEITPDFENGTITWYNGEPIFTADETYAQLWIQTWGGTVTVDSVELLDANYVPETPAVEDEPVVDTEAPTTGDKQSPETGVEGIAAVAGIVALAGVAVVASRKRK